MQNILPINGEAYYYPDFFSKTASDAFFIELQKQVNWKQEPIKLFGKEIMQPRLTAWYGDENKAYSYSGITMVPDAWSPVLLQIKNSVEAIAGIRFTSALLNYYRNQQDSMGWHRDNEKELGEYPIIASVSFGESREFQFRYYSDKTIKRALLLTHGSLLLMSGSTQHYWEHALPKRTRTMGGRINLTFRKIISS
ncbi:alpha-ketoglutarate-dependent dioxygenase AlkB [Flavihumibacter sp. CACIAM 22H1]|uniref:alpha-ketoglutarate-dependent dioxygenase AlkB family protein n=1 Tax=Flavihumibacter sp. CACIAM 22H1 TaxID=1812911 RepID=UPI0007A817D1|nr:alpha-ketoglutarate-dependent dioxygenase AlkB [Flavihumibacter sp. CACIAM 22H1]KYP13922.1 MAG: 2OG-Fe(II) oxygenase [Flavihumibacter sp. CACIAM 22H1]